MVFWATRFLKNCFIPPKWRRPYCLPCILHTGSTLISSQYRPMSVFWDLSICPRCTCRPGRWQEIMMMSDDSRRRHSKELNGKLYQEHIYFNESIMHGVPLENTNHWTALSAVIRLFVPTVFALDFLKSKQWLSMSSAYRALASGCRAPLVVAPNHENYPLAERVTYLGYLYGLYTVKLDIDTLTRSIQSDKGGRYLKRSTHNDGHS